MPDMRAATCRECAWQGTVSHCEPIAPRYLPERVPAGQVMPAGECPECGDNAMLDEAGCEPGLKVVTTLVPERATKFGVRSTAQSLANVMWDYSRPWSYRVQDLDRSGFRVAVHRDTPGAGSDPHGYLRIERA